MAIAFAPGKKLPDVWRSCPYDRRVKFLFEPSTADDFEQMVEAATVEDTDERGQVRSRLDKNKLRRIIAKRKIKGWKEVVDIDTGRPVAFSTAHVLEMIAQVPQIGVWIEEEAFRASINIQQAKEESEKNLPNTPAGSETGPGA